MAASVSHEAGAVFAALAGGWRLTRRFEPAIGTFAGLADFRPVAPGVLLLREEGELTLVGGHRSTAWREYRWVLGDAEIRVCFAEEGPDRVLHRLRPGGGGLTDVHLCGADVYTGRYLLDGLPDRFTVEMDVQGPNKGYVSRSDFVRRVG